MPSHVDETTQFWELHKRGALEDVEVIEIFVDRAEPEAIASDYQALPDDLRHVIRHYFRSGIPERMQNFCYFGHSTPEDRQQREQQRRTNIDVLLKFLQREPEPTPTADRRVRTNYP